MTSWTHESLSRLPKRFEKANERQWVERINIKKAEDGYECDMRFISTEEYLQFVSENTSDDIKDAIADLFIQNETNRLDTEEMLVDIYTEIIGG